MSQTLPLLPESVAVLRNETEVFVSIRFEAQSPLEAYVWSVVLTEWVRDFLVSEGIEADETDGRMSNG